MKKKVLAIILTLCSLISLTACTGSPSAVSSAVSSGAASQAESAAASSEEPKIEKITFATNNMCDSEDSRNAFCELFENDNDVKLEFIALPKEGYEDKLTALMMSGDLPDVIDAPTDITSLVNQELVVDLAPYLKENAALSSLMEKNTTCVDRYTVGDSIFAVAVSTFQTMGIWVRQDIMTSLNLKEPTTLDEFTNMLRAFKTNDPNGIPLTTVSGIFCHEAISNYFGVKNQITKKDDAYVDYTITEDYKEYLDYMKLLYTEKLLDLETPTNSSYGAVRTKFKAGEAYSVLMWDNGYEGYTKGLTESGFPDANPKMLTPFKGEKGTFGIRYGMPEAPLCITSGAKDYAKQIVDTFYEWYLTTESGIVATTAGIEGIGYNIVNGVLEMTETQVGHCGQSKPPVMPNFIYPFKFNEVFTTQLQYASEMCELTITNHRDVITDMVPTQFTDYYTIASDLDTKRSELYYLYITDQKTYDDFISEYNAYTESIGLADMMKNINGK